IHETPDKERVTEEFISLIDYLIKEFSVRFTQFKELSEIIKFIMFPVVTSFNKLNWLEIEEFERQLIDFQSSSTWIQKFTETS
ncbi:unnamed protein product, partial [Acanthoscelides obtectus]